MGYDIPVLNEREARAGAGILLLPAIFSFTNAYMRHDFIFTKIFVTFFMLDFFIRLFISPHYSPTLILGRFFVQNQTPEYVGAKQKKFAWSIGFYLSVAMFLIIVVFEVMTPIKIIICLLCITLLFSETAFGICLGCILYYKTQTNTPLYCPGDVCDMKRKEKIQKFDIYQVTTLLVILLFMLFLSNAIIDYEREKIDTNTMKCQSGKCGTAM